MVRLALPATTAGLRSALSDLSIVNRLPFGWEVIEPPDAPRASPNPAPGGQFYDLTGLSIEAALDKIVGFLPAYAWTKDAGVYHVRPKTFRDAPDVALNRPVDRLEASLANVDEALAAVHRLLDPSYTFRGSQASPPDRLKAFLDKPMTLALQHVTVRDVLDEIVRQNGDASWEATYADATGAYPRLTLDLVGFDGWSVGMPAHIR